MRVSTADKIALGFGLFLALGLHNAFSKERKPEMIKEIRGKATLTLQKDLEIPSGMKTAQFQNGKIVGDVEFYQTPRCYLHLNDGAVANRIILQGQTLKITKIDNIYSRGTVHLKFHFDQDLSFSDLTCISNYPHSLTLSELKSTLGSSFQLNFEKSVENDALFNTAPDKKPKVLLENSTNSSIDSARIILNGS